VVSLWSHGWEWRERERQSYRCRVLRASARMQVSDIFVSRGK
jgi:hypothetical protein